MKSGSADRLGATWTGEGVNFAVRAPCETLFSVGLMDTICPPSTVFAAYNYWAGPKQICIWPHNQHNGGETFQVQEKLRFAKAVST